MSGKPEITNFAQEIADALRNTVELELAGMNRADLASSLGLSSMESMDVNGRPLDGVNPNDRSDDISLV